MYHIFNIRCQDVRQNIMFKDKNNILYYNGTCLITHNITSNQQSILGGLKLNENDPNISESFKCHDDDIVCFDYKSLNGINLIASGQRGLLPLILITNADSKKVVNRIYLPKGTK